jgi:hypothetical protein
MLPVGIPATRLGAMLGNRRLQQRKQKLQKNSAFHSEKRAILLGVMQYIIESWSFYINTPLFMLNLTLYFSKWPGKERAAGAKNFWSSLSEQTWEKRYTLKV